MGNPSKAKGNRFEYQLVESAIEEGFAETKRAWGSNGKSLGWEEEVDLLVRDSKEGKAFAVQAKSRKCLPAYLQIPECCDSVAFKQDRGPKMVLISWTDYLKFCRLRVDQPQTNTK